MIEYIKFWFSKSVYEVVALVAVAVGLLVLYLLLVYADKIITRIKNRVEDINREDDE